MFLQAASDIYSPVSGKVTEVNETLNDSPDLVIISPDQQVDDHYQTLAIGSICMKDWTELHFLMYPLLV